MREQDRFNEAHLRLLPNYQNMNLDTILDLNIDFFDEYKRYVAELLDHFNKNEISKLNIILNGYLRQLTNYKDSKLKLNNLLIRLKQKIPHLYEIYLQKLVHDLKTDDQMLIEELFERENAIKQNIKDSLASRIDQLAKVMDGSKTFKSEYKLVNALSFILGVIGFLNQTNFADKFELDNVIIYDMFYQKFIKGERLDFIDLTTINIQNFDLYQKHKTNTFYGKKEILLDKIIGILRSNEFVTYKTRGNVLRLLMDSKNKLQRQLNDTASHLLNMLIDNPSDINYLYKNSEDGYSIDFLQTRIKKFHDFLYFNSENNVYGTSQVINLKTGPLHNNFMNSNELSRTLGHVLGKTAPINTELRGQDLLNDPEIIAEQLLEPDMDLFTHSTFLGILKDLFYQRLSVPYVYSLTQSKDSYYILYIIEKVIKEFISIKTKLKDNLLEYKTKFEEHLKDRENIITECLSRINRKYQDGILSNSRLSFESLESKINETFLEIDMLLSDIETEKEIYQEPVIPKLVLKARNELNMKKLPGSFELLARALKINLINIPFNTTLVKFSSTLQNHKRYSDNMNDDYNMVNEIYYMFDNLKLNFFRIYFKYDTSDYYYCLNYKENHLTTDEKEKIDFVEKSYFRDQIVEHHAILFEEDLDLEYDTKSKCFMAIRYVQTKGFDPSYIINEELEVELEEILSAPIPKNTINSHSLYQTEQAYQTIKEKLQDINNIDVGVQMNNDDFYVSGKKFTKEKLSDIAKRVQIQKDKLRESFMDDNNTYVDDRKKVDNFISNKQTIDLGKSQLKDTEKERLRKLREEREEREKIEKEENRKKFEELQEQRRKEEEERREIARLKREEKEKLLKEKMEEEKREKLKKEEERKAKELRDKAEKEEKEKLKLEQLKKEKEDRELKMKEEAERLRKQKEEDDRIRKEKLQREKEEKDIKLKQQQEEKEKIEKERKEKLELEKKERERIEKEKSEKDKLERERILKEKQEREQKEKERIEKEKQEKERLEKERLEKIRLEKEKIEKEKKDKEEREKAEKALKDKEKAEKERIEKEKLEKERQEKLEKERIERERIEELERKKQEEALKEKEQLERDRLNKEKLEKEKLEKEKLEKERLEKEKLEKEKLEKEKLEKERLEKERLEKEKLEKEKLEKEKVEKERLERECKLKEEQSKPKTPVMDDDDNSFDFDDDFDDIVEEPPKPVTQPIKTPVETTPIKDTQENSVQPKKGGIRGIRELRDTIKTPESLKNTIKTQSIKKIHLFDIHTIKTEATVNLEEHFMSAEDISQYYSGTDFSYNKFIEFFQELITEKFVFIFDVSLGAKIVENYEKDTVS